MRRTGWIVILLLIVMTAGCGGGGGGGSATVTSTSSSVKVTTEFPLLLDMNGSKVLPTYLSHLIGSSANVGDLANITIQNGGTAMTAQVSIDIPNYGSASTQTVSFAVGETKVISLSPNINYTTLFQNTTLLPASLNVIVSSGGTTLYSQSQPIQISGRNTVFWSNGAQKSLVPLITAMVTPNDKAGSVAALLRDAANRFAGGASMVGYQAASFPATAYTQSPGTWKDESFYLLPGESPSVTIDGVTTFLGAADSLSVYILDDANYTKWTAGQTASGCAVNDAATTGTLLQCAPQPAAGWYHIVYHNPATNALDRTVTRHRPMSKWEITYHQAQAIFEELRARGLVYVNLPGGTSYFSSSQNVFYPVEALVNNSANCIDGALLFASALERLGMEPIIAVGPGHAFAAVRCWPGSTDCVIPIETTMVGGAATFDAAYKSALNTWNTWLASGQLQAVDIKAGRQAGITPSPM